jgi:hypothetical protein
MNTDGRDQQRLTQKTVFRQRAPIDRQWGATLAPGLVKE